MTTHDIMTVEEVAEYLRVSERTVYEWAQRGEIPAGKLGTTWRFKRREIERWVDRRLAGGRRGAGRSRGGDIGDEGSGLSAFEFEGAILDSSVLVAAGMVWFRLYGSMFPASGLASPTWPSPRLPQAALLLP